MPLTMADIKQANAAAGKCFFQPATMRFFRSRVESEPYEGPGGVYFVTSEQFSDETPRRYCVVEFDPATGDTNSVGSHMTHRTRAEARDAAQRLAEGTAPVFLLTEKVSEDRDWYDRVTLSTVRGKFTYKLVTCSRFEIDSFVEKYNARLNAGQEVAA